MDKEELSVTIYNRSNKYNSHATLGILKEADENKEFTNKMYSEMQRLLKRRKVINNAVLNQIVETFRNIVNTVLGMAETISNEVEKTEILIDLTDNSDNVSVEEQKNEESEALRQDNQLIPIALSMPTHTMENENYEPNNCRMYSIYEDQTFSENNTAINTSMATTGDNKQMQVASEPGISGMKTSMTACITNKQRQRAKPCATASENNMFRLPKHSSQTSENIMQRSGTIPTRVTTENNMKRAVTEPRIPATGNSMQKLLPKFRLNQNQHQYRDHKKDKASTVVPYHAGHHINKTFPNFRTNFSEQVNNSLYTERYNNVQGQNYNIYNQTHDTPSIMFTGQRMETNQTQDTYTHNPNSYNNYLANQRNYN